ncbi:MAG: class I mannose-6-phosphate isomerase [Bryobacteraceae bacterium]
MAAAVQRLEPRFVERVWGTTDLSPLYPQQQKTIGEVWFDDPQHPLLVKFVFTTASLSVQVHPDDPYAREHEQSRGKTEMWHILEAKPGARIALGLRETLTAERLREASLSGEIEQLLNWIDVKPGATYFVPAGTIHAIGGGLTLCEIQQHSDITYRLYDYGRPRELHLDKGVAVSRLARHTSASQLFPIVCPHFTVREVRLSGPGELIEPAPAELWIVLEGCGRIDGAPFTAGEVFRADAPFQLAGTARLLRAHEPQRASD